MAPLRKNEAPGFPGRPVRDARSAEWELMSPLSLTPEGAKARIPDAPLPSAGHGPRLALAV